MAKNSIGRKIFQPDKLTEKIIDNYVINFNVGVSEFVNECVVDYIRPRHQFIVDETNKICELIDRNFEFDELFYKEILANVIQKLAKYPVQDCNALKLVLLHFTCRIGSRWNCYDYYNRILDERTDRLLRHYKFVLATIDSTYNPGKRELGYTSQVMFDNWEKLCEYPETYMVLSAIISAEDIYIPINVYDLLLYLKKIDDAITASNIKTLREFPDERGISLDQRIDALNYEICVYYGNSGYAVLTGDGNYEKVPSEIRDLWHIMSGRELASYRYPDKAEYLNVLIDFQRKCRSAFAQLKRKKKN